MTKLTDQQLNDTLEECGEPECRVCQLAKEVVEFRAQQKQSIAYCDSLRDKLDRYGDRIDTLHLQKQQLSAELKLLRELHAEPKDAEQAG